MLMYIIIFTYCHLYEDGVKIEDISNIRGNAVRKFIQVLSASVVGVSMMVGVASAATATDQCSIYGTGSDSYNTCESNLTSKVYASCISNIVVDNNSAEIGNTGQALVVDNTSAGSGTTGSVSNSNVVVDTIGGGCTSAVAVATTTTPAPTPAATTTPATTTPAAAPAATKVASLPETGSNSLTNDTVVGVIALGGKMAVSQLGVIAYRRFALK